MNQRVNDFSKRDNGPFMTGRLMLRHDEEMGDLPKSQSYPAVGGPGINAVLCLLQYLAYIRRGDLLGVQEDFPVNRMFLQVRFLGTDC